MRQPKLGRGVAVVGAGMTRFSSFPGQSSRDLFVEAVQEMLASVDQGFQPREIEALFIGNFSSDLFEKQGHTAPIYTDWAGLLPRPAVRVEDACASGGVALRQGIQAIASGLFDVVLVGGVEKMTGLSTEKVTDALSTAADVDYEVTSGGFTFPGLYAAMASAYMHRYGITGETLMRVAIKNHDNGALNPKAQFGARISQMMAAKKAAMRQNGLPEPTWQTEMDFLHDERANPPIAWPLRLFDCSPISDGAAALLLVSEDLARSFTEKPLYVLGTGQASDGGLHARADLTGIPAARHAAQTAYQMAGIGPDHIHVAEVHDCFTIAEVMACEDLGFFQPGEGGPAAEEGLTARHGPHPINTSGGLKSKGHPVGASGVGQVVEVWKQLRGEAGERQTPGQPQFGLVHNVGGSGQTCAVTIFERR
jgi:acetyl-CoA C-acetyltransferase